MRPCDVPACHASVESKARLYALAMRLNRRAADRGERRPFSHTALRLLDWLLWKAPRRDGGLWYGEARMAELTGMGLRSIQRGKAALAAAGLVILHPRRRRGVLRLPGGRALQVGLKASSAITFPGMRGAWPRLLPARRSRHRGGVGKPDRLRMPVRDARDAVWAALAAGFAEAASRVV